MAGKADSERIANSPQLLSVRKNDTHKRVRISYRTVRGRSGKAIFAVNDDVEGALDRWNESGMLEAADRKILNNHSLEGWATRPTNAKSKAKGTRFKDRIKQARREPALSPKQARLAKEADALKSYKDEYHSYWGIIAVVTVITLLLLSISSPITL